MLMFYVTDFVSTDDSSLTVIAAEITFTFGTSFESEHSVRDILTVDVTLG